MKNKAKADNSCNSMAVFGSACDPLHRGHEEMVNITLQNYVDRVVIWPSGASRPDKPGAKASNLDRIEMCKIAFEQNQRVSFVFNDLLLERFTRTHEIDKQIKKNAIDNFLKNIILFFWRG